jgi:uncharacterized protein (TIGR02611 family)
MDSSEGNSDAGAQSYRGKAEELADGESNQTNTVSDRSMFSQSRAKIRRSRMLNAGYRVGVAALGGAVIAAGAAMLVLPGPGWAAIFVGLAILSTEFRWARRLTERMRQVYQRAKKRALGQRTRRRNQVIAVVAVAIATIVTVWYIWSFGVRLPF